MLHMFTRLTVLLTDQGRSSALPLNSPVTASSENGTTKERNARKHTHTATAHTRRIKIITMRKRKKRLRKAEDDGVGHFKNKD